MQPREPTGEEEGTSFATRGAWASSQNQGSKGPSLPGVRPLHTHLEEPSPESTGQCPPTAHADPRGPELELRGLESYFSLIENYETMKSHT